MNDQNRQDAHKGIDHIFKDLLPAQGMPERPEQIALSHRMLAAMQDGGIALCDAGTGIGKTYAYLVNILKQPMRNTPLRYAVRQLSSPTGRLPPPCYLCRSTTGYQIHRTLKLLQRKMEVLSHGESESFVL